jgi:pimeloyl-ACP methyl ester carboxylesterase
MEPAMTFDAPRRHIKAGQLDISYLDHGPRDGWPCVLSHGFPYDVHTYAETTPMLVAAGARVIVPHLRGHGPTRFLSADTVRSGEQAVLGADLLALLDALTISRAVLAGYDWGGRASCIVAALWPERVTALVTGNSYNIQNIARSWEPAAPAHEAAFWYQWYFHSERGRRGLAKNRRGLVELMWRQWSPHWQFDAATFEQSASAFDNPDYVDVVIHSYRHRYGLVPGDPTVAHIETQLVAQPDITVPTIAIDGDADGVIPNTSHHRSKFKGPFEYRVFKDAGHNLPQERPRAWADAVIAAKDMATSSGERVEAT